MNGRTIAIVIAALTIAGCLSSEAAAHWGRCGPLGCALPAQSILATPQLPASLTVNPAVPVVSYRWGLFGRRIVPRVRWLPGAPVTYRPQMSVEIDVMPPPEPKPTAPPAGQ